MKIFKFYSGLFVLVHVRIRVNVNFDDIGCSGNTGHVISMISSTSRVKRWPSEKRAKLS